jgi:hypothetical protein
LAFVQRVDHDHGRDGGFHEGLDYQVVHLAIQGLVGDSWIRPHQRDEDRSKFSIRACKLDSEGGKDKL